MWRKSIFFFLSILTLTFWGCGPQPSTLNQSQFNESQYHYKLAYGYFFESKNGDLALQEILKSLKKNNANFKAHFLAGLIFSGRANWLKAIESYRRAIELNPQYYEAQNNLSTVYLSLGQWKKAIKVLTPLVQKMEYQTPAFGRNNLGWAYYKLKKYQQALNEFTNANQLNPQLCPPYNNVGLTYLALNDIERSIQFFNQGLKRCPRYVELYLNLGRVYLQHGYRHDALPFLKKCHQMSPDSSIGLRCFNLMNKRNETH